MRPTDTDVQAAIERLQRSYFAVCLRRPADERGYVMGNVPVHDLVTVVRSVITKTELTK